ncbi:hypothetical protein Leryth_024391 [Lithospermum erythrorhizon]|nr:hypothetical protein Leryth_024391 [Lithospermum erythrorhizon]
MVSQAAGQTRFRTLKHENGIAGSSAIVIRVIACFQPLQDCQTTNFQQFVVRLKWVNGREPVWVPESGSSIT